MSINSYPILSTLTFLTLSNLIVATAISAETVDPVKMVDSFEAAGGNLKVIAARVPREYVQRESL
jgi:hypothetical protein